MPILIEAGYAERQVMDWPPDLILDRAAQHVKDRDARTAMVAALNALGVWAQASEESMDAFQGQLNLLTEGEDTSLDAHLLNPDAQTDYAALRKVAVPVSVPKEEAQ